MSLPLLNRYIRIKILAASAVLSAMATSLWPSVGTAQKTYYVDECTKYGRTTCASNTGLNTVTASLQTAMNAQGWSGLRFTESNAWPQDWWEQCSSTFSQGGATGGVDLFYADSRNFSVFAGHGGPGMLNFNWMKDVSCNTFFQQNMRLGSMAGHTATVSAYLSCNALQTNTLTTQANFQWVKQQLGWNNTIAVGDNEARDFFNATATTNNRTAWLNEMGGSGRQPVVVSYGTSSTDCWNTHNSISLRQGTLMTPRLGAPPCAGGQPAFVFCFEQGS